MGAGKFRRLIKISRDIACISLTQRLNNVDRPEWIFNQGNFSAFFSEPPLFPRTSLSRWGDRLHALVLARECVHEIIVILLILLSN